MPLRSRHVPARPAVTLAALLAIAALGSARWYAGAGTPGHLLDATVALGAAVAAGRAGRRASSGRSRRGWRCSTAGLLVWTIAPVAWLTGAPEWVADVGRGGFLLLVGAAWWLTSQTPEPWSRLRLVIDGALAGASASVVLWQPLLVEVYERSGGGAGGVAAVVLPMGAIAAATLVSGVAISEIPRPRRGMAYAYTAGLLAIAASDVAHTFGRTPGWAVGLALVALGTLLYQGTSSRCPAQVDEPQIAYTAYLLAAPALASILVRHATTGIRPAEGSIVALMAGLLVVRQHATLVENRHLVRRLEDTERRLRHQAMHDSLTGLGGRALLHEHLDDAVAAHRRTGRPVATIFIDLDDFKQINDVLGHAAGDDVLVEISRRLADTLTRYGEDARAYRMSGDEFAIILTGDAATDPAQIGESLLAAIALPVDVVGTAVTLGGSAGVASPGPHVPAEASALLRAADVAMYGVKHAGKGGVAQAQGQPEHA